MKKWNAAKAKKQLDKLWSQIVHRRDKVCQFCFRDHGVMNAHHIHSRRHLATRWDTRNGLLVCFHCHNTAHNDIPWGHEWAVRCVGQTLFDELQALTHIIKPFDRAFYAVKLIELQKLLKK